ncbi:MAG: amidohydrolase family protein [Planctomycetota bacterium]
MTGPGAGGRVAARFVAVAPGEWLHARVVDSRPDGRLGALARATRVEDVAVLPALVNAHAHLQIAPLPRPQRRFLPWVDAVMAARAFTSPAQERARLRQALGELLAGGATAVGDIDATGRAGDALARARVRSRSYRELTGFHLDGAAARALVRARWRAGQGAMQVGLSPHAPYSVSAALFAAAAARTRSLAVHCAELPEEQSFLRTGRGPFRDLLQRLGRLPADFRPPGCGAVRWLERLGVLRAGTQLVHCQELERGDAARIAASGASIAVCPGTIAYFGRTPPPVAAWLAAGIPVAIGTDSAASNDGVSMRAELARAARMWPGLGPAEVLAMATTNGAASLGLRGAGRLRPGGRADFVVVPALATPAATLAAFVHGELPLLAVVCGGRRLVSAPGR